MLSGWGDSRARNLSINIMPQPCGGAQKVSDRLGCCMKIVTNSSKENQRGGPVSSQGRRSFEAHGLLSDARSCWSELPPPPVCQLWLLCSTLTVRGSQTGDSFWATNPIYYERMKARCRCPWESLELSHSMTSAWSRHTVYWRPSYSTRQDSTFAKWEGCPVRCSTCPEIDANLQHLTMVPLNRKLTTAGISWPWVKRREITS